MSSAAPVPAATPVVVAMPGRAVGLLAVPVVVATARVATMASAPRWASPVAVAVMALALVPALNSVSVWVKVR